MYNLETIYEGITRTYYFVAFTVLEVFLIARKKIRLKPPSGSAPVEIIPFIMRLIVATKNTFL